MEIYKLNFTKLQLEIFSLLCLKAGEKLSQREVAKTLEVSPTAITNSVPKLLEFQLLKLEKVRNINLITFNRDEQKAIELKRVENLKNIYLSQLVDYLRQELPGGTILLFGSYAKGEDTNTSDIDLAVIERKDKLLDLQKYEKKLNRKINVNFYTSWKAIPKHLKNNILNGILLQGSVEL
ncbi:TPA: hypothetical protein HA242_02415 [Candidatus Woesearchaeota archaeon]|nr:hypothetical protein [Candidatus Woesearchaeota archaeon]